MACDFVYCIQNVLLIDFKLKSSLTVTSCNDWILLWIRGVQSAGCRPNAVYGRIKDATGAHYLHIMFFGQLLWNLCWGQPCQLISQTKKFSSYSCDRNCQKGHCQNVQGLLSALYTIYSVTPMFTVKTRLSCRIFHYHNIGPSAKKVTYPCSQWSDKAGQSEFAPK